MSCWRARLFLSQDPEQFEEDQAILHMGLIVPNRLVYERYDADRFPCEEGFRAIVISQFNRQQPRPEELHRPRAAI